MTADLADLMSRYCDGDADAFRALYADVAPRLLDYLATSAHPTLACEMLQLTFLRLHRSRRGYVRGCDPVPWMFAIARSVVVSRRG